MKRRRRRPLRYRGLSDRQIEWYRRWVMRPTSAVAQWFEQLATKKYDLTSTYWSATVDPSHLYVPIGFSKSPWNFPSNQSKKIDAALEKFAFTTDQAIREAAYPDVVQAVAEEAPIIFLTNESQRYWTKPTLHGAAPLPSIEIRAEDLWRES